MALTAVIGGSGFDTYDQLLISDQIVQETPYGSHSGPVIKGVLNTRPCVFLPRHSASHRLPPHKVNYRANIWLLKQLGVTRIIAVNVVGGIANDVAPDTIVIPNQLIDYTYGREHTFYDGDQGSILGEGFQNLNHIEFDSPYSETLRKKIIQCLLESKMTFVPEGVYACTQGPRLETSAEIQRLKLDGCTVVGMTGMPEAALAQEIGIDYASIAIVVNWAAGINSSPLAVIDIMDAIHKNMKKIKELIPNLLRFF